MGNRREYNAASYRLKNITVQFNEKAVRTWVAEPHTMRGR